MSKVAVVGLGKLGACIAAVFADVGHDVIGVDRNLETIVALRAGIAPVQEPGLQELIDTNRDRLRVTDSIDEAVKNTDIAFIIVPTPSKADGSFDDQYVTDVALEVALAVTGQYTIVVCSTVMPGTCAAVQELVDATAAAPVQILYSPEFIALGSVIRDLRSPDMVLVGSDGPLFRAGAFIEVMDPVTAGYGIPWVLLSTVNAELAKISLNAYVTMKISFANQLAAICEGHPGADAREVLDAIGNDRRIGPAYLQPGGPFGGPCFPRDNKAFQVAAQHAGTNAPLSTATDRVNQDVLERIDALIPLDASVAILGMAYKPGTAVTERSLGTRLHELFPFAPCHDPSRSALDSDVAQALVDTHHCVVIATPWPEYCELEYDKPEIVIDVWSVLPDADNVVRLGVGR